MSETLTPNLFDLQQEVAAVIDRKLAIGDLPITSSPSDMGAIATVAMQYIEASQGTITNSEQQLFRRLSKMLKASLTQAMDEEAAARLARKIVRAVQPIVIDRLLEKERNVALKAELSAQQDQSHERLTTASQSERPVSLTKDLENLFDELGVNFLTHQDSSKMEKIADLVATFIIQNPGIIDMGEEVLKRVRKALETRFYGAIQSASSVEDLEEFDEGTHDVELAVSNTLRALTGRFLPEKLANIARKEMSFAPQPTEEESQLVSGPEITRERSEQAWQSVLSSYERFFNGTLDPHLPSDNHTEFFPEEGVIKLRAELWTLVDDEFKPVNFIQTPLHKKMSKLVIVTQRLF